MVPQRWWGRSVLRLKGYRWRPNQEIQQTRLRRAADLQIVRPNWGANSLDQMLDWLSKSWSYVASWLITVAALGAALKNWYAAELTRRELDRAGLEKQKLELEVQRLRNSPEVVADRRAIYERLRKLVGEVLGPLDATLDHIRELHNIRHDCEFRFPDEIVDAVGRLIGAVVDLHVTRDVMREIRGQGDSDWAATLERNHQAVDAVTSFAEGMVQLFKPYLSV